MAKEPGEKCNMAVFTLSTSPLQELSHWHLINRDGRETLPMWLDNPFLRKTNPELAGWVYKLESKALVLSLEAEGKLETFQEANSFTGSFWL